MSVSIASTFSAMRRRASRPMSPPDVTRQGPTPLLLLTSCALVLAPHTMHLPIWISLLCASLLLWRGWITFRGNRMPPQWLLLRIGACALKRRPILAITSFFGRDSGVAMVVLLLTLKLLEMHAKRDFICRGAGQFLRHADRLFLLAIDRHRIADDGGMIATLTTQLSFNTSIPCAVCATPAPWSADFRSVRSADARAFHSLPRIEGPLWGMPKDANAGKTGFVVDHGARQHQRLGAVGRNCIRAKFLDPPPPQENCIGARWCSIITMAAPGSQIRQTRWRCHARSQLARLRDQVRSHLEPTGQRWLFAIDLTAHDTGWCPAIRSSFPPTCKRGPCKPIDKRVRYTATSFVDYRCKPTRRNRPCVNGCNCRPAIIQDLEFAAKLRHPVEQRRRRR